MYSMYTNEFDFIIAEDETEVNKIAVEYGYDMDFLEEVEWLPLADDFVFTLQHEDGTLEAKAVSEWINECGKGYFAWSDV